MSIYDWEGEGGTVGDYICKYCQDNGCRACAGWCKVELRWIYPVGCDHPDCQEDKYK